jgi:hypothetical protein
MHELTELLTHPSAFLPGGPDWRAALNLTMVLVTVTMVLVAAKIPFPRGRGAIPLSTTGALGPDARTDRARDLTRTP